MKYSHFYKLCNVKAQKMQTNSNVDTEIRRDCQVISQPLLHRDPEDERKRTSKQDLTLFQKRLAEREKENLKNVGFVLK